MRACNRQRTKAAPALALLKLASAGAALPTICINYFFHISGLGYRLLAAISLLKATLLRHFTSLLLRVTMRALDSTVVILLLRQGSCVHALSSTCSVARSCRYFVKFALSETCSHWAGDRWSNPQSALVAKNDPCFFRFEALDW